MEETTGPEIYDGPLEEPVLDRLDQISQKLDGLNKCSISTVQMAKKVYSGLAEVKQVTGNLRAEIGKFHTTAAGVTQDLKQVDHAIVSMHERIETACSALETRTDQLLHDLTREQQRALDTTAKQQQQMLETTAKQFLATLETPGEANPIHKVGAAVAGVRGLAWTGIVIGIINLVLIAVLVFR